MNKQRDKRGRFKDGHKPPHSSFNNKPHVNFDRIDCETDYFDDTPDSNPRNRQTDDSS